MRSSWWKLALKIVVGLPVMGVALMGLILVRAWVVNPQGSRRWKLECSANLQNFFTAQRAHMREKGRYTTSVITRDRKAPDGEDIPPGQPYHEVDDEEW